MTKITVRLLKPLNGAAIGSTAEYTEREVARLEKLGAVQRLKAARAPANKMAPRPANKAATSGGDTK